MSKNDMLRWSGLALILAGVCIALGTLIHPSNETPATIVAQENRLIIGHWLLTFYCGFLLLGLPGAYASRSRELGRLGLAGFLMLFVGTLFYAVSSDYGFNAPVLARLAPATLDAINAYPPVVAMDAAFVLLLFAGFIILGIAIGRSRAFPAWSGALIAGGWLLFTVSAPLALFVFEPLWILVILGTVLVGAGLAWIGFVLFNSTEQV
jgi:hypothetical protein